MEKGRGLSGACGAGGKLGEVPLLGTPCNPHAVILLVCYCRCCYARRCC